MVLAAEGGHGTSIRLYDSRSCDPNIATIGVIGSNGVRTCTRTNRSGRAKHSLSGWTVSVGSTHTMSVDVVIERLGTRPRWVLITAVVCGLVPRSLVAPNGWTTVTRAISRAASAVPFIM